MMMFTVEQHVRDAWHILFRGDRAQANLYWDAAPAGRYAGIVIRGPGGAVVRTRRPQRPHFSREKEPDDQATIHVLCQPR
jgi:hypothetical protein